MEICPVACNKPLASLLYKGYVCLSEAGDCVVSVNLNKQFLITQALANKNGTMSAKGFRCLYIVPKTKYTTVLTSWGEEKTLKGGSDSVHYCCSGREQLLVNWCDKLSDFVNISSLENLLVFQF